jgi:hypothetical protein
VADWSLEDRAAARAFLQRCEVRLSTLHRVATALLSGAGLMVILPVLVRDQITGVLRTLLTAPPTAPHWLLTVAATVVLAVPLIVLFLLLGDLTRFYFHAQHVPGDTHAAFAPRFTLTGLLLPAGDLSTAAETDLNLARSDPTTIELLVPPNQPARDAIDRRLDAYGGLNRQVKPGDVGRMHGLLELVASRSRTPAEEIAKVELGMARHLLRLQVIVLRYVKALLAFLTTALAVFAAAAAAQNQPQLASSVEMWLAGIFAVWAPTMVFAVSSPVRWISGLLRAEGATVNSIANDREFTRIERLAVGASILVWAVCAVSVTVVITRQTTTRSASILSASITAVSGVALYIATIKSIATNRGPRPPHRLPR